ncbi:MAG: hypothetical protein J7J38_01050 [Candidatus Aenigmarchaeota archaeon]|nr:hypothetical protein [Candidatus Aenigmarchaeota archaeon]
MTTKDLIVVDLELKERVLNGHETGEPFIQHKYGVSEEKYKEIIESGRYEILFEYD